MNVSVVVGVVLATVVQAPEEDRRSLLDWRDLQVEASLGVELWQDDNILLTPSNEVDDLITVIVPRVAVQTGPENAHLNLEYRGRDRHFNDHSEFNGMDHFGTLEAYGRVGIVDLKLWDSYERRNDPFNVVGGTKRIEWMQNEGGGTLGLHVGGFNLEASGEGRLFALRDDAFDYFDHVRWRGSLLAAYEVMDRLDGLVEAGAGHTEYADENQVDDFGVRWIAGGLRGRWSESVQLTLKAGEYRVRTDETSGLFDTDDESGLYVSGALTWQMTEFGQVLFEAQRRPIESIYSGWARLQRFDLSYSQTLWQRVTLRVGGFYEWLHEAAAGENREARGFRGGIQVALSRHVLIDAYAEGREKDSDLGTLDYDNLRGFIGTTVMW